MKITDIAKLKSSLEEELGFSISSLERVANPGEVNDVFIVNTERAKLITRVNESNELGRFEKEKWCIEQSTAMGVNTPKVLSLGIIDDYAYLVEAYAEGVQAKQLADQSLAWLRIGKYARAIHEIKVQGFGETIEDIIQGNQNDWDNYLEANLQTLSSQDDIFMKACTLSSNEIQIIRGWLQELSNKELRFGLNHGDLSLANTLVDKDQITLIDWGAAEAHVVPHYDLGVILEDSLSDRSGYFHKVLEGYGMSYDEYLAIKPDILAVMLLIGVDKMRWAIDKRPKLVKQMSEQLVARYKARKLVNQ